MKLNSIKGGISQCLRKSFLVMRLTLLFTLLSTAFAFSSNSYAQNLKLSLRLNNANVKEVLRAIEDQSEFIFFYQDQQVDLNRKVNIAVEDENITEILDQLFKGTGNVYAIRDRQIVIGKSQKELESKGVPVERVLEEIQQQTKIQISGSVQDSKGLPLPGVTVAVKGTTNGTITDGEGKFTISIPADTRSLSFSFVGLKSQEIMITGKTTLMIVMKEEAVLLSEVIAVGYGVTTTREKLSSSISSVQGKLLTDRNGATTPLGLLAGLATGVRVTARTSLPGVDPETVQVREVSTWKGGVDVLYIIDGVVRDKVAFQTLNPNDIDNISVLKDAASAAIYGMKAGGGVLLVTTKSGESGKMKVQYGYSYSSSTPYLLQKRLNAYDYAMQMNKWHTLAGRNESSSEYYQQYELDYFKEHSYDAYNEFWTNPKSQNHNISLSGGDQKAKYFISGSLNSINQPSLGIGYDKYTILAKLESKLTDRLTLNFQMQASWDKNTRPSGGIDGGGLNFANLYTRVPTKPYYKVIDGVIYPLDADVARVMLQQGGESTFNNNAINSNASLKYRIPGIEGLFATARFSYYNNASKSKIWDVSPYYYNFVSDRHIITDNFNYASSQGWKYRAVQGNSTYASLTEQRNSSDGYQGNYQLNYSKSVGLHNISAFAGYEFRGSKGDYISAYRRGFALESYNQINGGSTDVANQSTGGDITSQDGMASWIGRLDYDFNSKYILGVTFRRDGSYKFAPDKRWGNFPAVSAAWIISKEQFFEPLQATLSSFKIRGSWGITGTDNTNAWQWMDTFSGGAQVSTGGTTFSTLSTSVVPNPYITWEKNSNYNLGADLGVLNNALTFSIEGWYKRTTDILSNRVATTPLVVGAKLPDVNYGIASAQGVELTANYQKKIGEFIFSFGGNISHSVNKLLLKDQATDLRAYDNEIDQPMNRIRVWEILVNGTGNGVIRTQAEATRIMAENAVGASRLIISGQQVQPGGVFARDIRGSNNTLFSNTPDGSTNQNTNDDKIWVDGKYSSPRLVYGLNTNIKWKGFELNMIAAGAGAYWRAWDRGLTSVFGQYYNFWPNEWTPANINAGPSALHSILQIWAGGGTDKPSTLNLYNMAFLRMKNMSLGYTIPEKMTRKIGLQGVKFYMNIENPFMIYKMCPQSMDPESNEAVNYPILRSYSIGVNVTI